MQAPPYHGKVRQPTSALPGSDEKIEVLRARYQAMRKSAYRDFNNLPSIFHPLDAREWEDGIVGRKRNE